MSGLIEPARAVGGDLYDVVVPRPGEVCFVIGDVSGKGIPAALFMAVTDTLFVAAARETASPEALLARVNDALVEENSASMFVTLVCGMLDTGTGRLRLASGGHTRCVLLPRGETPRFLGLEPGCVVGIAGGQTFPRAELTLGPGDALFLYTDGVTEAHDPENQLFGEERLLEHLSRNAGQEPPALAEGVKAAVARFARETPQFDDIAILVVRRPLDAAPAPSPAAVSRLEVPATPAGLVDASGWLGEWCSEQRVGEAARHDLDLALDEVVANVIRHGYGTSGLGSLRLSLELDGETVRLEVRDTAAPFNPLKAPAPGEQAAAGGGGLGIEIVRRSMDRLAYLHENGENRLVLERRRDGGTA
jgi:sigma-B regulation protein RsbU (phosphoserine phosphatase)